jgi:hypothetical protein
MDMPPSGLPVKKLLQRFVRWQLVNVAVLSAQHLSFDQDEAKSQDGAKVDRSHVEHARQPNLGLDWRIAGDDGCEASPGLNLPNAGETQMPNAYRYCESAASMLIARTSEVDLVLRTAPVIPKAGSTQVLCTACSTSPTS